jgi:F-type H+-transporting ATPase subunit epsilon
LNDSFEIESLNKRFSFEESINRNTNPTDHRPPTTDFMAERIQLEIVTPEKRALADTVDSVTLPGLNGEMEILPGHKPLISALKSGVLSYKKGGASERMHVSGGFAQINDDKVSVLAEIAERATEIDAARARQEREQAERQLANLNASVEEHERARLELERANARLQLVEGGR